MSSSEARRKRGVVRRSITYLNKRLTEVEEIPNADEAHQHALHLMSCLSGLDAEFKTIQYNILSDIDEGEKSVVAEEQEALDKHDEVIDELSVRIKLLLNRTGEASSDMKVLARSLATLKASLHVVHESLKPRSPTEPFEDLAMAQQFQDELADIKTELTKARDLIYRLELPEKHELCISHAQLMKQHFDCCHMIRIILNANTRSGAITNDKGLKVPKLEAPAFDGDLLNWNSFWEQFSISIDERTSLSDAEKFVYLQHSLKEGSAKNVIQGLSGTGEHYAKAVECLKARYDRPRLVHQSHVKSIIEAPPIKDGSGRELRRLHDTLQQHLRALDAADCDPLSCFITSTIQLKLDPDTLFEWQKHTQAVTDVPQFTELLEFIDMRARASESSSKRPSRDNPPKRVSTFFSNTESTHSRCVLCKAEKHPLYFCQKFKAMSQDQRLSVVRNNSLCMNCLKPGHFLDKCKSAHHCKRCQRKHHTLLHIDTQETNTETNTTELSTPPTIVSTNALTGTLPETLLMTCQVIVESPNGQKMKVRALLDSASTASFISERLVQSLGISRSRQRVTLSGVAGLSSSSNCKSVSTVVISPTIGTHAVQMSITAIVVPRVTCDLPLATVKSNSSWMHLDGIPLADPSYDIPGPIDLLMGVDVYVKSLLYGRRSGPPDSPVAFETVFRWVLAGKTQSLQPSRHVVTHFMSTTHEDNDLLHNFWEIEELHPQKESLSMEDQGVLKHFETSHYQFKEGGLLSPFRVVKM